MQTSPLTRRNVEIKARVRDRARLQARIEAVADRGPTAIDQTDTFYHCPSGRLKLRAFAGRAAGELIHYQRADASGPRESRFTLAAAGDARRLGAVLAAALGERAVVRKRRLLYHAGRTRIHLDEVEGLGCFCELEVALAPGDTVAGGERTAAALMERLGIGAADLVARAYVDLLEERAQRAATLPEARDSS